MNQLLFLGIISFISKVATSCSIGACLTWYGSTKSILLRCRMDQLKWRVTFFNQLKIPQAYCISPLPEKKCYSFNTNGTIDQNIHTNITVLVIKGHIDSTFNGEWSCEHGTNIDKAIINVTVIKEVTVDDHSSQENCTIKVSLAATIPSVVFILTLVIGCYIWRKEKNTGSQSHRRGGNQPVAGANPLLPFHVANNTDQGDTAEPNSSGNIENEDESVL